MLNPSKERELKQTLSQGHIFKLVCGAGNEQPYEVYWLSYIYTIAGADIIDIAAMPDIVVAAKNGIRDAYKFMKDNNYEYISTNKPFITISIGMEGDTHTRKASIIKDRCLVNHLCSLCVNVCPQDAIDLPSIDSSKCIGCGKCQSICRYNAIKFIYTTKIDHKNLLSCIELGADIIELHASVADTGSTVNEMERIYINLPREYISLCINREKLSNEDLIDLIKESYFVVGDTLMIQSDGIPMSGFNDEYNSSLQSIATADIINKNITVKIPIILSGGTNSKTAKLSKYLGVDINGVAIGSYARKIVKPVLTYPSNDNILIAIETAKSLVKEIKEA